MNSFKITAGNNLASAIVNILPTAWPIISNLVISPSQIGEGTSFNVEYNVTFDVTDTVARQINLAIDFVTASVSDFVGDTVHTFISEVGTKTVTLKFTIKTDAVTEGTETFNLHWALHPVLNTGQGRCAFYVAGPYTIVEGLMSNVTTTTTQQIIPPSTSFIVVATTSISNILGEFSPLQSHAVTSTNGINWYRVHTNSSGSYVQPTGSNFFASKPVNVHITEIVGGPTKVLALGTMFGVDRDLDSINDGIEQYINTVTPVSAASGYLDQSTWSVNNIMAYTAPTFYNSQLIDAAYSEYYGYIFGFLVSNAHNPTKLNTDFTTMQKNSLSLGPGYFSRVICAGSLTIAVFNNLADPSQFESLVSIEVKWTNTDPYLTNWSTATGVSIPSSYPALANSMAYGNNIVVLAMAGFAYWVNVSTGTHGSIATPVFLVTFGAGKFVAVDGVTIGTLQIKTSTNGITWNNTATLLGPNLATGEISYEPSLNLFILACHENSSILKIYTSADAITWTSRFSQNIAPGRSLSTTRIGYKTPPAGISFPGSHSNNDNPAGFWIFPDGRIGPPGTAPEQYTGGGFPDWRRPSGPGVGNLYEIRVTTTNTFVGSGMNFPLNTWTSMHTTLKIANGFDANATWVITVEIRQKSDNVIVLNTTASILYTVSPPM